MTTDFIRRDNFLLGLSFAIFAGLYLIFYPPTYAIQDEASYFWMAEALRRGYIFLENSNVPINPQAVTLWRGHWVPSYPFAMSVFLMALLTFGKQAVFLTGILFHFLGAWAFNRLRKLFGIRTPTVTMLYLFFPAFVLYSRTLMTDIPAAALFLWGCYFYFRSPPRWWAAGLFFGLCVMVRYGNAVLLIPFGIGCLYRAVAEKRVSTMLSFMSGLLPLISIIAYANFIFFGSPFLTAYSKCFTGEAHFSLIHLKDNLSHYLMALLVMYPFMLPAVFFSKKIRRPEVLGCLILFLSLYAVNLFHDRFPGTLATWVFGVRYLFPIIPFFLIAYADGIEILSDKFHLRRFLFPSLLVLFTAGAFLIDFKHQRHLEEQAALQSIIAQNISDGSLVVYDHNASELISAIAPKMIYIPFQHPKDTAREVVRRNAKGKYYFVKRDTLYADTYRVPGIPPEEWPDTEKYFNLTPVFKKNGLEIYEFQLKE